MISSFCISSYVLVNAAPFLAFLYGLTAWANNSYWREAPWSDGLGKLSVRLALLVAAVATNVGLCQAADPTWVAMIPVSLFLALVAAYLMYQTRIVDVVGSAPPSYPHKWMHGKVVVVTGANTGIGKATAQQLAELGATVYLACRSQARAEEAIRNIQTKRSTSNADLHFLPLDLGDLDSVRQAAKLLQTKTIDVLICNAGVMMGTKALSKDGYELMMQANHLGHFLLTQLLLPQLSKKARILCLTSCTYEFADPGFDFEDMFCDKKRYTLFGQYAQTKLANILFAKELARRYPQHSVFAVHPGIVRTDVTRNMPWYLQVPNTIFAYCVAAIQKTPTEGAYGSIHCACSDDPPKSGSLVSNCKEYPTMSFCDSVEDAKRLWHVSELLVELEKK